jgi:hypothetical protein
MIDLKRSGVIGRYADHAFSMVGSISMFDELATDVAPQIVAQCRALEVDLLLVVPYCPQCHVAAAVLARAIERRGVPTTSLTTLYKQARSMKPPRATFLDFPLGCPGGRPGVADQQRAIVRAAIQTGTRTTEDEPWTLPDCRSPGTRMATATRMTWSSISTASTTRSRAPSWPTCPNTETTSWAKSKSSPSAAPVERTECQAQCIGARRETRP